MEYEIWNFAFHILNICCYAFHLHTSIICSILPAKRTKLSKLQCTNKPFFPQKAFLLPIPHSLSGSPSISRSEIIRAILQWAETFVAYLKEVAVKFFPSHFKWCFAHSVVIWSSVNDYWQNKLWKTSCYWKCDFSYDSVCMLYSKKRGYGKKILLSGTLYHLYVTLKKKGFQWFIIQVELPIMTI